MNGRFCIELKHTREINLPMNVDNDRDKKFSSSPKRRWEINLQGIFRCHLLDGSMPHSTFVCPTKYVVMPYLAHLSSWVIFAKKKKKLFSNSTFLKQEFLPSLISTVACTSVSFPVSHLQLPTVSIFKLYSANNIIYNTKQYFTRLYK